MYELLAEYDFLITDYSSSMFEMGYIYKPVWLYVPDIKAYMNDRGFYFSLNNLPFPLATDNDKLNDVIVNFDKHYYHTHLDEFMQENGIIESGNASIAVVDEIVEIMN